jgi:hypothetical protein
MNTELLFTLFVLNRVCQSVLRAKIAQSVKWLDSFGLKLRSGFSSRRCVLTCSEVRVLRAVLQKHTVASQSRISTRMCYTMIHYHVYKSVILGHMHHVPVLTRHFSVYCIYYCPIPALVSGNNNNNNNNNNNPWRYSSDEPWPAERPPLAVFSDCTRRYWVDMWSVHRIPQLQF